MRHRIVRTALVVTSVALVLLGLPLTFAAVGLVRADEVNTVERAALRGAGQVNTTLGRSGDALELPSAPQHGQLGVYDTTGTRVTGTGPAQADAAVRGALAGRTTDAVVDGRVVVAVPVRNAEAVIGASRAAGAAGATVRRVVVVVASILALAGVSLLVAWVLARLAARRLSTPVDALAAVANAHAAGDLTARANRTGIAELDDVADGMNASAEAVADALARERALAAEASHQLRTPLTRVRWGLEAALDGPHDELRDAARLAIGEVDDLDRGVTELLAATRPGGRPDDASDLLAELDVVLSQWTGPLAASGRRLALQVDRAAQWHVAASSATLRHILGVLMENAETHGAGLITLRVRETVGDGRSALAVDVVDEGTFVGAWPTRPDPASEHGLGLLLAQRLAAGAGGRVVLTSRAPTTVTVLLRRAEADRAGTQAVLRNLGGE